MWFAHPCQLPPKKTFSTGEIVEAVTNILNKFLSVAETFGPHEWGVISVVTIVIGYMCLKGMNIR